MRVLSFDVGIKNLAYCVVEWNDLETSENYENLKIYNWDVINVVESKTNNDNIKSICLSPNCKGKVKSFILNDQDMTKYFFCSKHLPDKDQLLEPIFSKYEEDKWCKISNSICCKCSNPTENATENATENDTQKKKIDKKVYNSNQELNMILCNKHHKLFNNKIISCKNKLFPIKKNKVKDMTSDDLKFHLVKCLDQRKDILLTNIDMVLIENQPTFKNPTMKAISDTLYTWFMIRGIFDKEINNSSIQKIKFISPSNKLKEFNKQTITDATETKKYSETKKLSIENTKSILLCYNFNTWLDVFSLHQKKDDLADSFLQGWYVLNSLFDNKLYNQWQELYKKIVIITTDQNDDDIDEELVQVQAKVKVKRRSKKKEQEQEQKQEVQEQKQEVLEQKQEVLDELDSILELEVKAKVKGKRQSKKKENNIEEDTLIVSNKH